MYNLMNEENEMKKTFKISMTIDVDVDEMMTDIDCDKVSNGIMSDAAKFIEDQVFSCIGMKPVYIGIKKHV